MTSTTMETVRNYVAVQPLLVPITAKAVAENATFSHGPTASVINTYLKRIADTDVTFKRHQKGIYYRTKMTSFGDAKLNPAALVRRAYLEVDNHIIGYETGPSYMQKIGLTTLMPKYLYLATNRVTQMRKDEKAKIVLIPPRIEINAANHHYCQLLDMLANPFHVDIDTDDEFIILNRFVRDHHLDYTVLLTLAIKYDDAKIFRGIARTAAAGLNR